MPYIEQKARERIDAGGTPETKGELNYALTVLMIRYVQSAPSRGGKIGYGTISDAIAAANDAAAEMRRRLLDPYEDACVNRNGDCYPISILEAVGLHYPVASTIRTRTTPPMQHQPGDDHWLHSGGAPEPAEHKKEN